MEIGLFSKCVKDLIVDLEKVEVPGLGTFYAENIPATFSDKGNTINPPSRRMFFKRQDVLPEAGEPFYNKVCENLSVSKEQAKVELDWCLSRIHSELSGNRNCVIPGLGEMKSSSNGEYFFIPEDELDICPESFGLEPVCIKVSTPVQPQEPTIPVPVPEPEPEPVAKPEFAPEPVPQVEEQTDEEQFEEQTDEEQVEEKQRHTGRTVAIVIAVILAVLILLVAAAVYFFPEESDSFINSILYTQEELELLGR